MYIAIAGSVMLALDWGVGAVPAGPTMAAPLLAED